MQEVHKGRSPEASRANIRRSRGSPHRTLASAPPTQRSERPPRAAHGVALDLGTCRLTRPTLICPPVLDEGARVAQRRYRAPRLLGAAVGAAVALASICAPIALGADTPILDIKQLTLEELMEINVYSAARRLQPVQETPSATYVLTNEDIRRARVTSIPEALRLVPGVQVARVDANKWAVSIRGFNTRTANKLLVLIDGRSVYDPLFSGVLWEARDVTLEDVERIEVVRGPGGTLWGSNAVNGVINIITKHARDTQGGLIAAGGGTEERAFGAARYGWQPRDDQHARLYAKSFERDAGFSPTGNAHDQTQMSQAGFRWDWDASARDVVRVSGDLFSTTAGQRDNPTTTQDVDHRGGNLLTYWTRQLSETDSWRVQFYYDRVELDNVQLGEKRDTYDVEFQHNLAPAPAHRLVWGLSYRNTRDDIRNAAVIAVDPARREDRTETAFVQNTIILAPERWNLTLGTKVESNDYSGVEWQPNARLAWTPDERRVYWAAASRAVRVPSRLEADLVIGGTRLGDNAHAESVRAYEFGHRRLVTPTFWYDVATFYNIYRHLLTREQTLALSNRARGRTYGVELASRWQATPSWRLDAAYTYLQMDIAEEPNATALQGANRGENPHHQLALRSAVEIRRDLEFDATLRFVDDLPALNVPAYTELDLGLSWRARPGLELLLVGQNLLHDHHPEQEILANGSRTEVQRGVYAKLTWRF